MNQYINQFELNSHEENFLSIDRIQKNNDNSISFRGLLISHKYRSFPEGKKLKGDLCYGAYFKDFFNEENNLKYTIYCYCYNLKDLVENPEAFEFSFEAQIETERGVIGMETIQWDFRNVRTSLENIKYFEDSIEVMWKHFGSFLFPS